MPEYVTLESACTLANALYHDQLHYSREGYATQVAAVRRARKELLHAIGNPDEEQRNALLRMYMIKWQERMQRGANTPATKLAKRSWGENVWAAQNTLQYKNEPVDPQRYVLWVNSGKEPYKVYDIRAKAYVVYGKDAILYNKEV